MELVKAEDYGLDQNKAEELTGGLKVVVEERKLLIQEFENVSKLELTPENLPAFKELRLKLVKNRTTGINNWHKTNKAFFLTGGKFVDAIKNKEIAINEAMEGKLMEAEKHFQNLEIERLGKLQLERVELISEFLVDAHERDLSIMPIDVWTPFLADKKQAHLDFIAAELKAEQERKAAIETERVERERIRKENEELKKAAELVEKQAQKERLEREAKEAIRLKSERVEREKNEAILKAERLAKEKIEAELRAEKQAQLEAKEQQEQLLQNELNKGDKDKVNDLIKDLEELKTKYSFQSKKNQETYVKVGLLIDKVVNFIN